jgi:hypothetical protein
MEWGMKVDFKLCVMACCPVHFPIEAQDSGQWFPLSWSPFLNT